MYQEAGATARDIFIHVLAAFEDSPLSNAGKGAALTIASDHEVIYPWINSYGKLEAGRLHGHSGSYGTVPCLKTTKNPILATNAILQYGVHCMLGRNAADDMAQRFGLESVPNMYLEITFRRAYWRQLLKGGDGFGMKGIDSITLVPARSTTLLALQA